MSEEKTTPAIEDVNDGIVVVTIEETPEEPDDTKPTEADEGEEKKEHEPAKHMAKAKFNGEEVEYDPFSEEAIATYQKGLNYDTKTQKLNDKIVEYQKLIDAQAAANGMDRDAFIAFVGKNQAQTAINAKMEALRKEFPDADEALLHRLAEKETDTVKPEEREQRAASEKWDAYMEEFPDVTDVSKLPQTVQDAVKDGKDPIAAMYKHLAEEKQRELDSVKEAQKAAEQNQVNKKKTTGSAGSYTAPPSKDPEKMSYEEYVAYRRGT